MGPPCSDRITRVPPYSRITRISMHTGLSPTMVWLSRHFCFLTCYHWTSPRSLATTNGVSVDFLSSGYWDVSLRRVCFVNLCIQLTILIKSGFPHSDISGSTGVDTSPELFAACHVLHRLWSPRHPPNALKHLKINHAQNEICKWSTQLKLDNWITL